MTDDRVVTTRSTVTFKHPFTLPGLDEPHPPGTFDIDIDNELIEGVSGIAHRHVATFIYLMTETGSRMVSVDPGDLNLAGERDPELDERRATI